MKNAVGVNTKIETIVRMVSNQEQGNGFAYCDTRPRWSTQQPSEAVEGNSIIKVSETWQAPMSPTIARHALAVKKCKRENINGCMGLG